MADGRKTANVMDIPLSVRSVVAKYLGDSGYKFQGVKTIYVLSIANGSLSDYDETDADDPFGGASLVVPAEQTLTIAYNKAMLLRIQKSQIQDIPVSRFSKKVALQQADEVFVPAHDAYSLGKILAARPVGNKVTVDLDTDDIKLKFNQTIDKAKTGGANLMRMYAWIAYDFASRLKAAINFTGSDQGYKEGKNGYLGKFAGVNCIETPDDYLGDGVHVLACDKRAIVNVTPKMDPKGDGVTVIEKVPKFSGIEIQLRDRADTFVLNKKARVVASLEDASSS